MHEMTLLRRDNFLRAGEIWMKIWSVLGLTCLTFKDLSVSISKIKVLYSALTTVLLCVTAYYRYTLHVLDTERPVDSYIQVYTACSSAICSALMVLLTMVNRKKEAVLLSNTYEIRKKYLLKSSRSLLYYFPLSCMIPCISLIVENIVLFIMSISTLRPITLVSYCFSVYSFLFQGEIRYYFSMVENGLKDLNDNVKILENTASTDIRDKSVKELRGCRLMYHELSTHSKNIDELFSSRVILTVGHNFGLGVLFTFNAIVNFVYPKKTSIGVQPSFLLTYWALCCFLNLYVLVQPCERVRNEARHTPIAVQSLSTRPGYKVSFYNELQLFSAQLVLDDFQPAPHNFVVLDNRMLLATLGAVSSSLAILLQILMTKN